MTESGRTRIRVDWEELLDAFEDASNDHRYYLDRETGAVHFFSSYLDHDDDEERSMSSEERYVLVPKTERNGPRDEDVREFVRLLGEGDDEQRIREALRDSAERGAQRACEALERTPSLSRQWRRFRLERMQSRIQRWLTEVGVEPL
jgi:hypothetical protein